MNQAAPGARLPNVILPIFILPPGAFRLCLAMAVFLNHTLPVEIGSAAVYIFFLLSGYWVFRMWQQQYRPYPPTGRDVPDLAHLAFAAGLLPRTRGIDRRSLDCPKPGFPWQAGLSWTALHFDISTATLLGYATLPPALRVFLPVWSLDVELQFYLVAPLVIAVLTAPRWSGARLALYALAALGLLDFIIQYGGIRAQSGFLPMYLAFFVAA